MTYLAHPKDVEKNIPIQSYRDHILGSRTIALDKLEVALLFSNYSEEIKNQLRTIVKNVMLFHDLGKLDDLSQHLLKNPHLFSLICKMINHTDAGVAYVENMDNIFDVSNFTETEYGMRIHINIVIAELIRSHHTELFNTGYADRPNYLDMGRIRFFAIDIRRFDKVMRDSSYVLNRCPNYAKVLKYKRELVREYTDRHLSIWQTRHYQEIPDYVWETIENPIIGLTPAMMRLLRSVVTEGDHGDTSAHYGVSIDTPILLHPDKRKTSLEKHVKELSQKAKTTGEKKRNRVRNSLFDDMQNAPLDVAFYICAGLVGTAKTYATLLLSCRLAQEYGLRRIIDVAPFTNIVHQTAQAIKDGMMLDGEIEYQVVGEHHHQADFFGMSKIDNSDHLLVKLYSTNWDTPFVTTTAVQFAETLASSWPGRLRKLSNIYGSVIILDEWHTCVPVHLLRQFMMWLKYLVDECGCKVIFASGSMVKFWDIEQLKSCNIKPHNVISEKTEKLMRRNENERIIHEFVKQSLTINDLVDFVLTKKGPRIIVGNTVFTTAVLAKRLQKKCGEDNVLHISGAESPNTQKKNLAIIKKVLKEVQEGKRNDNFTLVATSCVECGVDLSFRVGFRENASLMSLLQLAGRVNRNGEYPNERCSVFGFDYDKSEPYLTSNSQLAYSQHILQEMIKEDKISDEYCTEAIQRELDKKNPDVETIENYEYDFNMGMMCEKFTVIPQLKTTVVVDSKLIDNIRKGKDISSRQLISGSVQIYYTAIPKISQYIEECDYNRYGKNSKGTISVWNGKYDDFIGYMAQLVEP